jgi:hypothetical protein
LPVCLKAGTPEICATGVIIRTCAVTCHVECIRLLAGTGMNICHNVSMRIVIPIECTTNTCCCSLETRGKFNIWCWICPFYYHFWTCDTTFSRSPILQQE